MTVKIIKTLDTKKGVAYKEIVFFDSLGNFCDELEASFCLICEHDKNGNILGQTWGQIEKEG